MYLLFRVIRGIPKVEGFSWNFSVFVKYESWNSSRLEQELIHSHVRIGYRLFFYMINGCYLEFFRIKKKEIKK
jgi:hypothetical protein